MDTLLEGDPDIKEAHRIYQEFSNNSEYREIYEAREKWLRDYNARLLYTEKKAKKEAHLEDAKKMLENGISIELVIKITGLSKEEIEEI